MPDRERQLLRRIQAKFDESSAFYAVGARDCPDRALASMAICEVELRGERNGLMFLSDLLTSIGRTDGVLHLSLESIVAGGVWDLQAIQLLCGIIERGDIISLNLGEVLLDPSQAKLILAAVKMPSSNLVMAYFGEPTWGLDVGLGDEYVAFKPAVREALRHNRKKPGYINILGAIPSRLAMWIGKHRLFFNVFAGWAGSFAQVEDVAERGRLLRGWLDQMDFAGKAIAVIRKSAADYIAANWSPAPGHLEIDPVLEDAVSEDAVSEDAVENAASKDPAPCDHVSDDSEQQLHKVTVNLQKSVDIDHLNGLDRFEVISPQTIIFTLACPVRSMEEMDNIERQHGIIINGFDCTGVLGNAPLVLFRELRAAGIAGGIRGVSTIARKCDAQRFGMAIAELARDCLIDQ
jgi:hypothetical protein